jgi:hypothetical protein
MIFMPESFGFIGIQQLLEKYKENFDVLSEGPSCIGMLVYFVSADNRAVARGGIGGLVNPQLF